MKLVRPTIFCMLVSNIYSCGNPQSRVHHKQRTSSDIKINSIDLNKNIIDLRLDYRSYVKKRLNNITCNVDLNGKPTISIGKQLIMDLDPYSAEIIEFSLTESTMQNELKGEKFIKYGVNCLLDYNKGKENLIKKSVLYIEPGSQYSYR